MLTALRTVALVLTMMASAWSVEEPASFPTYDAAVAYYLTAAGGETMTPDSTAIARATYFPSTRRRVLLIHFTSNPAKPYVYEHVPAEVWDAFTDAESKGKYFNAMIKGRYGFALVP